MEASCPVGLIEDLNKLDMADIYDSDATTAYMQNPSDASTAFECFTVRECSEGECSEQMLFCSQQKRCCDTAVTAEMINEEVIKVSNSLPEDASFVLVVIALKVTSDIFKNVPDNCIVVTGPALERFYSVFSARVNLLSVKSLSQINVNTASTSDLMTIDIIGSSTAASIISNRTKNGYFKSWMDLIKRIPRTQRCEEDVFIY